MYKHLILFTFFTFTLTSNGSEQPSFNCDQASVLVEKLICNQPKLSKLDNELNRAYKISTIKDKQISQKKLIYYI